MECVSVTALQSYIDQLQPGDWFIVDVDDTLITPQAMMFRPSSPFYAFIDDFKKATPSNLVDVLSTWRSSRKVMLVEQEWPAILELLKSRGVTVLALTYVHSGAFGKIPSMESWRTSELKSLGITFSAFAVDHVETLIDKDTPATVHKGIMFTGSHSKADVLKSFITKYGTPSKVVFFDDRLNQVELLETLCREMNISYKGYHYLATTQLPYSSDKDYGEIQTHTLVTKQQWIEDEEAQKKQGQ